MTMIHTMFKRKKCLLFTALLMGIMIIFLHINKYEIRLPFPSAPRIQSDRTGNLHASHVQPDQSMHQAEDTRQVKTIRPDEKIQPPEKIIRHDEKIPPTEKIIRHDEKISPTEKIIRPGEKTQPTEKIIRHDEKIPPTEKIIRPDEKIQPTENLRLNNSCPCGNDLAQAEDVPMAMETNMNVLIPYFRSVGFKVEDGVGKRQEVLDPELEAPLFRYRPLTDIKCLPDERMSKVFVVTPRDQHVLGARIEVRADLFTRCGSPRRWGGDEVRMWLKSADGRSSIPAKVTDLQNGSYVGESVLKWRGVILVRVALTYPREYLRTVVELHHTLHSLRWTINVFDNGRGLREGTPCIPSSPVPGFRKLCNLTDINDGRQWFCGHPQKKGLNCSHFGAINNLPYFSPLPLSPQMKQFVLELDKCCATQNNLRLIKNNIKIETTANNAAANIPPQLPPCRSRPKRESWDMPTPRGWLRNGQWQAETCTLPELTKELVQRCLRNTTLLLHGDSNQKMLWLKTEPRLTCTKIQATAWHAPRLCENTVLNTSMLFAAHALPFSVGTHAGLKTLPLPRALDWVEKRHAEGRAMVVVLHLFMHLSTHPLHDYRSLVRSARQDVERFLRKHPKAKFVVRGPHVLYQGNSHHAQIGDHSAHWYKRVWREEFEGLLDKVWYLDVWDLTIASENLSNHPEPVADQILRLLFGYVCDG